MGPTERRQRTVRQRWVETAPTRGSRGRDRFAFDGGARVGPPSDNRRAEPFYRFKYLTGQALAHPFTRRANPSV
jgi:hypothetical protein